MNIALVFLALGVILLIVAIVLIVLAGRTGRGRAAWAREHGWEFRREDPDLAREWSNYWGTDGAASNVLSGRVGGRVAHLARIGENSVAVLRRTGNSDVVLRMYPAAVGAGGAATDSDPDQVSPDHAASAYPGSDYDAATQSAPGTVATLGGWDIVGDNAVIPALDSRFEQGLAQVREIGNALVVDPWWVIVRATGDLPMAQVPEVFAALSAIDDACRALPSATAEVIDFTQSDPTRAFGADDVSIGGGPYLQAVNNAPVAVAEESSAATLPAVSGTQSPSTPDDGPTPAALLETTATQSVQGHETTTRQHETTARESEASAIEAASTDATATDTPAAENEPHTTSSPSEEATAEAESSIDWHVRPETPRQPVTMPRRDRSTIVGSEEDVPPLADESGELPVVGEDPEHQRTHYRPGRIVRVQAEQYPAIFGHSDSGRHRRPAARHASENITHPETAEIIAIHDPEHIGDPSATKVDPQNIIDTTEHIDGDDHRR